MREMLHPQAKEVKLKTVDNNNNKNMLKNKDKANVEKKMIGLTREQFFALLKAVYLGNWMANANRDGSPEDPHKKEYEEIEDYIFSYAKYFGFAEYVDDEEAKEGKFFPTRKFEEETDADKLHEEYDEETFWDELSDSLGERDFYSKYSDKEREKMSREEHFIKMQECIIKWENELIDNGIERLGIK